MATKKLTTGELNLLKEIGVDPANVYDEPTTQRSNRFTGEAFKMNEAVAKIHDTFYTMMNRYERGDRTVNVGKMDRVKYLVLKFNSDAYMGLID